jgi:branched-chain amino acid transport system substrate-binding protein
VAFKLEQRQRNSEKFILNPPNKSRLVDALSGEKSSGAGRRGFLKFAVTAIVAGVVAGVGGYFSGVAAAPPPKTITEKVTTTLAAETVTKTVAPPPITITKTVTVTPTVPVGKPVRIGFHAPLTGPGAADGKSSLESALIAIDEINAAGGIRGRPLELVYYDDRLDAKETIVIIDKMIELDKVVAIISGSYSGPTRVAAPRVQANKIPYISAYATHPEITQAGDYVFRPGELGPVVGDAVGYLIREKMGLNKVAVLVCDVDYTMGVYSGLKDYAKRTGLEIVVEELFAIGDKDFTGKLTKIKTFEFDVLCVFGYYFHAPAVKQARDLGITQPIVGIAGFDSPKFVEIAGEAAEGAIIVTTLNRDDPRKWVQEFIREYEKRTGIPADMVGALTYDAVRILAEAMKAKGFNPKDIRDGLAEIRNFETTAGILKEFTPLGEAVKDYQVQIIKDGKYRYYDKIPSEVLRRPP